MYDTANVKTLSRPATAKRLLADRINETAAPQDKVTGSALRNRVLQASGERNLCESHKLADQQEEGKKTKMGNPHNSQQDSIGRTDQEPKEEQRKKIFNG